MVKPEDVVQAIVGTWLYINRTSWNDDGTVSTDPDPGLGKSPVGMLTYDALGYMSANFMSSRPEDRPEGIDTPPTDSQPQAEWALVGKHTLSYAGPWYVSETTDVVEKGQITHGPTRIAWLPSWVGIELQKNYTLFDGGETMRFIAKTADGKRGEMYFERQE
ncbi:hypothetical protein AAE478_004483 [Parahypoxylon ruwenzoriense]